LELHKDRFPSFREQANIALRHHRVQGKLKCVPFVLLAGADHYASDPYDISGEINVEDESTALMFAAFYKIL
jgi:hypothetical protein